MVLICGAALKFGKGFEVVIGYFIPGVEVGILWVDWVVQFERAVVFGVGSGGIEGYVRPDDGFLGGGIATPMFSRRDLLSYSFVFCGCFTKVYLYRVINASGG